MKYHALLFEIHGIQNYIFSSGKLMDVVAASHLLECLTEDILTKTLSALGLACQESLDDELQSDDQLLSSNKLVFSRRAGGVFYVYCTLRDSLVQLRDLWALTVFRLAPGLAFSQIIVSQDSDENAFALVKRGMKQLQALRNEGQMHCPPATPFAQLYSRTGGAALANSASYDEVVVDERTLQLRTFIRDTKLPGLVDKFVEGIKGDFSWPTIFSEQGIEKEQLTRQTLFPFSLEANASAGAKGWVALVHIDGNGLGEMLIELQKTCENDSSHAIWLYSQFSKQLRLATVDAAKCAVKEVLLHHVQQNGDKGVMPMRPILLGGDDITFIIRADLAVDYSQAFIKAFEDKTKTRFAQLLQSYPAAGINPAAFTASGGICFIKPTQPFQLAATLAESLTVRAKTFSKQRNQSPAPSSLALHQVTSAFMADAEECYQREICMSVDGGNHYRLAPLCYLVNPAAEKEKAQLTQLIVLAEAVAKADSSEDTANCLRTAVLRDFVSRLREGEKQAENAYKRLTQIRQDEVTAWYESLRDLFSATNSEPTTNHWLALKADDASHLTVIADVLSLAKMRGG